MRRIQSCGQVAVLTDEQVREVTDFDDEFESNDGSPCMLIAGHTSAHVSFGGSQFASPGESDQRTDWRDLWIQWSNGAAPGLVLIEPCDSGIGEDEADDRDEVICELPDGHEGPHCGATDWWDDAGVSLF